MRERPPELTFDDAFQLAKRAGYPIGFISDVAMSEVHFREQQIQIWDLERRVEWWQRVALAIAEGGVPSTPAT